MKAQSEMLGTEKISKLLFKLSAPATVGMVVSGLYNIVDTIFVGRALGDASVQGIAAIAVSFPVLMISMAISLAIGLGGASIISRRLGARDLEGAERTFGNIIGMSVALGTLVAILGIVFITPILELFGATPTILPFAKEYLQILLYGSPVFMFSLVANNVARSEGNARVAMLTMVISGVLNIILDPIFIFGLGMGIKGAAIATVISYFSAAIFLVKYFVSGHSTLVFRSRDLKPDLPIIKEVCALGLAPFARNSSMSIVVVFVNNILAIYGGDLPIAVYGIFNRLLVFASMPLIGLLQGMQPIIGFNYGAGNYGRVLETLKLSLWISTAIAVFDFVLLYVMAEILFSAFTTDELLIESGVDATRIMVLAVPLLGIQFISAGMYQALGKALPSFILSMARQTIFLLPLLFLLPLMYDLEGVWLAFPVADALAFVLTSWMLVREYRIIKAESA
ncbi:putative MATE family efflux protein [Methanohalophilus levihalophilus]|uniref:MATE family efflux transporter n=1 Tax=Methanohalophilus levihalophilus TaxID=1431282 RepID=UPI001AE5653F|nr:MATE family efflux transporter [Methanohalophilus levihalophilus]MBP2030114.1 putative MATE family efflux protein [Methanohalophilus levihalophilus]